MHTVAAMTTHNGQVGLIRAFNRGTIRSTFFQARREGLTVKETARSLAEITTQGALVADLWRGHTARRFCEYVIRALQAGVILELRQCDQSP